MRKEITIGILLTGLIIGIIAVALMPIQEKPEIEPKPLSVSGPRWVEVDGLTGTFVVTKTLPEYPIKLVIGVVAVALVGVVAVYLLKIRKKPLKTEE